MTRRGSHRILTGDVRQTLAGIEPGTVQQIISSPPYWGQRDYGMPGQIGLEEDPEEYIAHLVGVFRLARPALHPTGTLWLNLGDCYATGGGKACSPGGGGAQGEHWAGPRGYKGDHDASPKHKPGEGNQPPKFQPNRMPVAGRKPGDLMNMPHRVAEALVADGWYWRGTVIWHKKNPISESVTGWRWVRCRVKLAKSQPAESGYEAARLVPDHPRKAQGPHGIGDPEHNAKWAPCPGCPKCRPSGGYVLRKGRWRPTTGHEYLFLFSAAEKYYADGDAVQEPASTKPAGNRTHKGADAHAAGDERMRTKQHLGTVEGRLTRNPRTVWSIAGESYKGAHFATMPTELVRRCLLAGTSAAGCCPACRTPYAPLVETERRPTRPGLDTKCLPHSDGDVASASAAGWTTPNVIGNRDPQRHIAVTAVLGYWPACACHAGGLPPDSFEAIASPTGGRAAEDPSRQTGRAGFNRPRGPDEGQTLMTRYEQREYARQIKAAPHADAMKAEAGERFAHYVRTDRSGARPVPADLLESWIARGWLERVAAPDAGPPAPPVPCLVLDPFGGSGTTAQVATWYGRDAVVCELNPDYVAQAVRRIAAPPRCLVREQQRLKRRPPAAAVDAPTLFDEVA